MSKIYMIHACKNTRLKETDPMYCNNAWIDEDLTGQMTVQTWKYCESCCAKYGFINPEKPPKKKMSPKQIEVLERNKFKRKNSSISNEIIVSDRNITGENKDD